MVVHMFVRWVTVGVHAQGVGTSTMGWLMGVRMLIDGNVFLSYLIYICNSKCKGSMKVPFCACEWSSSTATWFKEQI